jgi:hypothetical protein
VVARRTAIASLALALLVGFVLVMQLLEPYETASDTVPNSLGLIMNIAAFAVELPAFTRRWATRDTSAGAVGRSVSVGPEVRLSPRARQC